MHRKKVKVFATATGSFVGTLLANGVLGLRIFRVEKDGLVELIAQTIRSQLLRSAPLLIASVLFLFASSALAQTSSGSIEGQGALRAIGSDGGDLGNCPLERTDVDIAVSGFVSRATVTQTFRNTQTHRIEAIYTFPLPHEASVRDFRMRVGNRVIVAELKEREQAEQEYREARERGDAASLLTQERPNIFVQSIANIQPGESIEVTLEYVDVLQYQNDKYELLFPMTIGPRFSPTPQDAEGVTPPYVQSATNQTGTRNGRDVNLQVHLNLGVSLRSIQSPTHRVNIQRGASQTSDALVSLEAGDSIPNRDFVLEIVPSAQRMESAVLSTVENGQGYATLFFVPPSLQAAVDPSPREFVFVLDTSGSMHGLPMDKSKAVMDRLIAGLRPRDRFTVMTFDDQVSTFEARPVLATAANIARGRAFVADLDAQGGTMMMNGIRAAMTMPHDENCLKMVVFLTDGFVGNDSEILGEVDRSIGDARLFSFGIGSSVNRYLLSGLAERGRGAAQYVLLDDQSGGGTDPDEAVNEFVSRLSSPVLTHLRVIPEGVALVDPSLSHLPDVFAGHPLAVHYRYAQGGHGVVRIEGRAGNRPFVQRIEVDFANATHPSSNDQTHRALSSLWARAQIEALDRQQDFAGESPELRARMVSLSLAHRVLCKHTAFVAVERRSQANASGQLETVEVPNELPAGVSPERIFGSNVSLSLARLQPGDPEVRIDAPRGAQRVEIFFPFGETVLADFESELDLWTARFLVPRGTPDGIYEITILITHHDGHIERMQTSYTVDSTAPVVSLSATEEHDGSVRFLATQILTEAELGHLSARRRRSRDLRVAYLADVDRLTVRTPDGQIVVLHALPSRGPTELPQFAGTWSRSAASPASTSGNDSFEIIAFDLAGNRSTQAIHLRLGRATR